MHPVPAKKILLVDMHNTLVDEAKEYGPAIDAAIDVFLAAGALPEGYDAQRFKDEKIYPELKAAHSALGDDWDSRAFDKERMPSLRALIGDDAKYEELREIALVARAEFSRQYIQTHAYPGALEAIADARDKGHTVYIVTDANAACAEATLSWLGLDGKIDGLFCPSSAPEAYAVTPRLSLSPVTAFAPGVHKPDAAIVADILLYHANKRSLARGAVFSLEADPTLPQSVSNAMKNKLSVKPDGEFAPLFTSLLQNTIGIGDDYRDHILFHNAGITSVAADYGRMNLHDEAAVRGKKTLEAVSGWAPERLNLLGLLGGKRWLETAIHPHKHLAHSLTEIAPLLAQPRFVQGPTRLVGFAHTGPSTTQIL